MIISVKGISLLMVNYDAIEFMVNISVKVSQIMVCFSHDNQVIKQL